MEAREDNEQLETLVERYYRAETAGLHARRGLWAQLEPCLEPRRPVLLARVGAWASGPQRYALAAVCAAAALLVAGLAGRLWQHPGAAHPPTPASPVAVLPRATTEAPSREPTGATSASPRLQVATLEEAERALGVTVPLARVLPAGAVRDDDLVRYDVAGERGMISIAYRVGQSTLALEYLKEPPGEVEPAGERVEAVGPFQAHVSTQAREPSDPLPPMSEVAWRDGELLVRVTGDLPVEELLRVARSMYD